MKGTNLGEFEELVLLVVNLDQGVYGLKIKDIIEAECSRKCSLSAIHASLARLEKKGYVKSRYESVPGKGGRPKLIFNLTSEGLDAIRDIRNLRNRLWNGRLSNI